MLCHCGDFSTLELGTFLLQGQGPQLHSSPSLRHPRPREKPSRAVIHHGKERATCWVLLRRQQREGHSKHSDIFIIVHRTNQNFAIFNPSFEFGAVHKANYIFWYNLV